MIKNLKNLELLIRNSLNDEGIYGDFSLNYSNLENVDLQINSLVKLRNTDVFEKISSKIKKQILDTEIIDDCLISEKGFINITLNDNFYKFNLKTETSGLKNSIQKSKKTIFLDYGGANIGKSLHVGHLRTLNIGRSLKNLYSIAGCKVISDIHFGDWGMPMGLIIAYIEIKNIDIQSIKFEDLETIYPEANNLAKEDKKFYEEAKNISKELNLFNPTYIEKWKLIYDISTNNIKIFLKNLGFSFDLYNGESDVIKLIPDLVEKFKKENLVRYDEKALIANDNQDPPAIIVKSDGSYMYLTTDIATIVDRENNFSFDECLYIVDQRQSQHFKQLFKIIEDFSLSNSMFKHIGFGTINNSDGKPLKTRDGGNYKLSTLYDDVKNKILQNNKNSNNADILTQNVLTYSDLVNSRLKNYNFDLENFTNVNGKSAVYLQYTQVRAKKLLENNEYKFSSIKEETKSLIKEITKFDFYFEQSIKKNEPHHLAEYIYRLCQEFNSFYNSTKIFSKNNSTEEVSNYLYVVKCFYSVLEVAFEGLGLKTIDSM